MVQGWGWYGAVASSAGVPFPFSCKLSDPLEVIPDGLEEGGIQSTPSSHSQQIQLTAWAPPWSTYMKGGAMQRVKKTSKPSGSIAFLYLNAKCCETKWLPSFSSKVNTFPWSFTGPLLPHIKQIAHAMKKKSLAVFYGYRQLCHEWKQDQQAWTWIKKNKKWPPAGE